MLQTARPASSVNGRRPSTSGPKSSSPSPSASACAHSPGWSRTSPVTTTSSRSGAASGVAGADDAAPVPSGALAGGPAGSGEQPARTVAPARRTAVRPAAGP